MDIGFLISSFVILSNVDIIIYPVFKLYQHQSGMYLHKYDEMSPTNVWMIVQFRLNDYQCAHKTYMQVISVEQTSIVCWLLNVWKVHIGLHYDHLNYKLMYL